MARTNNSKTKVGQVVLSVLISSTLLLAIVENQNLCALTSGDRYNSGFSHGEQRASIDFQNNIPFNPGCAEHTSYYCAGYFKAYNVTWNNLAKGQTSYPNPPASNSTNPLSTTSNTNTTAANPPTIISPSTDNWVGPLYLSLLSLLLLQ